MGIPLTNLGPYDVRAKIARGGMATVHVGRRALDSGEEEIVALKVINRELANQTEFIEMFLDEARLVSKLRHPNIAATYEIDLAASERYIAMELLLGRALVDAYSVCAARGTRMPADLAAYVGARVADALAYAHNLKDDDGTPLEVVHRDVNPTNIFLTYDHGVKLIDFGLAKSKRRIAKSTEGVVKGKVPYLSPEQILEEGVDGRSDIYTLGITLWEITTGRRLFKRENDVATIRAVQEHDIPDAREIVPGFYPDELWKIVSRALERNRENRYQTASEMAEALDALATRLSKRPHAERMQEWLEELFPGERERQTKWLAAALGRTGDEIRNTFAPPVPLPGLADIIIPAPPRIPTAETLSGPDSDPVISEK